MENKYFVGIGGFAISVQDATRADALNLVAWVCVLADLSLDEVRAAIENVKDESLE